MIRATLFMVATLLCFSCAKTKKLSNSDLAWNPYEVGDKLIFQSNNGDEHTLEIKTIERSDDKTNPYAGDFSGKLEQEIIYCSSSEDPTNDERILTAIGKTSSDDTFIHLNLDIPNTQFPGGLYLLSDLENRQVESLTIEGNSYSDVLVLTPENVEMEIQGITVEKVYWSKSSGYIRYDMSDGTVWSLKQILDRSLLDFRPFAQLIVRFQTASLSEVRRFCGRSCNCIVVWRYDLFFWRRQLVFDRVPQLKERSSAKKIGTKGTNVSKGFWSFVMKRLPIENPVN